MFQEKRQTYGQTARQKSSADCCKMIFAENLLEEVCSCSERKTEIENTENNEDAYVPETL